MVNFQDLKNEGFKFHAENNLEKAEKCYIRALEIDSKNAEIFNLLGIINLQKGNINKALEWIKKAINIEKNAYFYETLFQAYIKIQDFQSIVSMEKNVEKLFPQEFSLIFNIALANKNLKNIKDSIYYYKKSIEINPNSYDAWFNLSHLYEIEGETYKAVDALSICKRLKPNDKDTEYFYSIALLRIKDYDNGLKFFESRLCKDIAIASQNKTYPNKAVNDNLWHGEDISNKTIFVYYEAGLGDVIMFARYLPLLKQRCKKIILKVHEPLVNLFLENNQLGVDEVIDKFIPEQDIHFDVHVPMLSLPYALGLKGEAVFTGHSGYLKQNEIKKAEYKEKFFNTNKIKIGIKWQGNTYYDMDRVIPTEEFFPLIDEMSNAQFYSFQTFEGSEEVKKLTDRYNVIDIGKDLRDFTMTSAALSNLDLVICNDTSLAHLAGALNIPCWIMLPYEVNWRWHTDLSICDWYDSVKLFRQKYIGNWTSIFKEALEVLKNNDFRINK